MLARRILGRAARGEREIVVITDGEPTAHFEDGQVEFSYPPTRRTISETLREVARCTRDGHHHQHVHARAVAGPGRVRGAPDEAQPRPGLLRDARAPRRVRAVDFVGRRRTKASSRSRHRLGARAANYPARVARTAARRRDDSTSWLFRSFLFLHVAGRIVAFGPTFSFPFIGAMGGREPQHANFVRRRPSCCPIVLVIPDRDLPGQ